MTIEKRPIETAPKDGTWVLLFGGNSCEDFYNHKQPPEEFLKRPIVARWEPDYDADDGGYWVYAFWDGEWRSIYDAPTHWAPLH